MAFPWLLLSAGLGLINAGQRKKQAENQPKPPEKMSYDEAYGRAEEMLEPRYQENREQVMSDINNNLVSRGFYGQAPGDAMRAETMGDMQSQYESQLVKTAMDIQNQNFNMDYKQYQANLQNEQQQPNLMGTAGKILGGFMAGPGGSAIGQAFAQNFMGQGSVGGMPSGAGGSTGVSGGIGYTDDYAW